MRGPLRKGQQTTVAVCLSVQCLSVCLLFVHPYSTLHAAVLHAPNTTPVPQFQAIAHGRHSKRAGERVRKPGQASHPRRCCSHASTCPARRLTPTWRTDESRRRWRPGWFSKVGVENAPGRGTGGEGRMGIWMDGWTATARRRAWMREVVVGGGTVDLD